MKTVYVLTSGEYSDYHISGVFSTKKKAERFILNNPTGSYDRYDIEEWELDERQDDTTKTIWCCVLSLKDGTISGEWSYELSCKDYYTEVKAFRLEVRGCSSVSREHAQKLAIEKRQETLRLEGFLYE